MIEKVKRWIEFRIKRIEFQVKTWKNAYTISKAYSNSQPNSVPSAQYPKFIKSVVVFIFVIGILVGAIIGIIKMDLLHIPNINNESNKSALQKKNGIQSVKEDLNKEPNESQSLQTKSEDNVKFGEIKRQSPVLDSSLFIYNRSAKPIINNKSDFMVIVANKARHVLYLLNKNIQGNWHVIRTYFIAVGEQSGRKEVAGDRRTPEGMYLIIERKEDEELSSIYGPLAYVLDYPNKIDREEGRTGTGIWIHGTETDSFPVETRGCIEISNSDLIDLSQLLKSGEGTPVIIVNDSILKNPLNVLDFASITSRRELFFDSLENIQVDFVPFLTGWASAWESRNIENYANYYHLSKFNSQGMNWEAWKEKKIFTFSLYDTINVTYSKLAVSNITDSSAVLRFAQVYKTEKTRFVNNKRLDLEKEQGKWKIIKEAAF